MAKARPVEAGGDGDDFVPVKIRKSALRLAKTISAWKDEPMSDWISRLIYEAAKTAAPEIAAELKKTVE